MRLILYFGLKKKKKKSNPLLAPSVPPPYKCLNRFVVGLRLFISVSQLCMNNERFSKIY